MTKTSQAPWPRSSLKLFERRGWTAFVFQRAARRAFLKGQQGLVHSATGTGKTVSALLGPIQSWIDAPPPIAAWHKVRGRDTQIAPLSILWLTPLRALASDTETSIASIIETLELPWTVERRTSDVSASIKKRQRTTMPTVLVTTPESLSLLLSYEEFALQLAFLKAIVVDEWHELLGTKRGVQTELALAAVSRIQPAALRWGLSATLGNLSQALQTLVGASNQAATIEPASAIIEGTVKKKIIISSLIPKSIERFPWAGHLGLSQSESVVEAIEKCESTLIFANTRNQTELWYQELLRRRPTLAGQLALHHGSLDAEVRRWVEDGLKNNKLKGVVCTSSLDLGVDFTAVDQVVQIGSPKGAARMLQRAGRSGHTPGQDSHMIFVPTHALELIELAAVRDVVAAKTLEARVPLNKPLDVLVQHLVTVAIGGGFKRNNLLSEVRTTYAYKDLTDEEFDWAVDFVVRGGSTLQAYEDFNKVQIKDDLYYVDAAKVIKQHRYSIGTIASDTAMQVRFIKGAKLGQVEEQFISKLKPGDKFLFAGRLLELSRIADNTAWVRRGKGTPSTVPRWQGGRLPLSTQLGQAVRQRLDDAKAGRFDGVEMKAVKDILELQQRWSAIPGQNDLLVESIKTRDGYQLFIFPFAGRLVHEGLSSLLAYRLSKNRSLTFHMAINDYGFLLHTAEDPQLDLSSAAIKCWFTDDNLLQDCAQSVNASEMGRRQFREVARVAGLVNNGQPGRPASTRQLQASSNLFYEVFQEYDPQNLLLEQCRREVLQQQLEWDRLRATLDRIAESEIVLRHPRRPTPLAFPLLVDRLRQKISTESLADRVKRLQAQLENAAEQEVEPKLITPLKTKSAEK